MCTRSHKNSCNYYYERGHRHNNQRQFPSLGKTNSKTCKTSDKLSHEEGEEEEEEEGEEEEEEGEEEEEDVLTVIRTAAMMTIRGDTLMTTSESSHPLANPTVKPPIN